MSIEKIIFIIFLVILYIGGEYLWISKILMIELDFIIENNKESNVINSAKYFKSKSNFSLKYLFDLYKFIIDLEKIPGIKLSYRSKEDL